MSSHDIYRHPFKAIAVKNYGEVTKGETYLVVGENKEGDKYMLKTDGVNEYIDYDKNLFEV